MPKRRLLDSWMFSAALFLLPIAIAAQEGSIPLPDEVRQFLEKDTVAIALETGDLNADGRSDYVLVTSEIVPKDAPYEEGAGERSVRILIRDAKASLTLAARNDLVAMCRNCGGVFGDPFEGVTIRGTRFTVSNYGGSNDRWAYSYTFAYARRDRTWQAVRVEQTHFHALDPERTMRTRVYTPPKDFGLITFADFDPGNFRKKGRR